MAAGTLYTYPENWRAFKALIAAQYSGAQVRVLSAPPHFHFGQTNRTPEFLRKFPAGKVPAFEGDDGFCVFESNAIAYYVSNEDLRGSSPEAAAQVVQWVSFAESQPKKDTPRKEKGPREEKPKPQAERKEEKKAAAPAAEEEMDECEQALAAEPKAKDPFAHLPKSTFVLDEFKRKYSNEDTLAVALPYFWEHFDKDGWSLWYAEYRFPEELTQTFMSCNLITGMFQRLDKLRKNAFASVILFGTNNSSSISGVWVFRGQELAFPLSPDWQVDYESYTWRKLDPGSAETQTLVREYFCWEGAFQHVGKAFNQGKIFK
uniref:Elongation factor 1-gamma n=1 Tax=Myotis myotis TaxID=51298 RepID=A0A7J7RGW2_MYOMY|nr:eukaryotic translation elongation factor 1 gamma [Myotis myotis]